MGWPRKLLVFNCILLILVELFQVQVVEYSIRTIVELQRIVEEKDATQTIWWAAEVLGPNPRPFSMLFIIFISSCGEEAIRWILIRFFAIHIRWVFGMFLQEPRPFWMSDRIEMLHCPETFGLPAGHTIILGALAFSFATSPHRSRLWFPLLTIWMFAMGVGRLYLGTHSIHDLVLGLSFGVNLAVWLKSPEMIWGVERFLDYEEVLVFVLLLVGITSCFGFAEILHQMVNPHVVAHYMARAKANGCRPLDLFNPLDGVFAFASVGGLGVALSLGRTKLERGRRVWSAAIFLLPRILLHFWDWVVPRLEEGEIEPQTFLHLVMAACNFFSVFILFTVHTPEEEARLLIHRSEVRKSTIYGTTTL